MAGTDLAPWLLCLALATLPLLYLLHRAKPNSPARPNLPPGPTPLPIIGSLHLLGDLPHRSLARLAKTHGPLMALRLGSVVTVVASSPSTARDVLQKNDQLLSGRSVPDSVRILDYHCNSMVWIPASAPKGKHVRSIIKSQLFTQHRLDAHQDLRRRKALQLVDHIRRNSSRAISVGRSLFGTTLNMLSSTFFSVDLVDLDSDSAQEFRDLVWETMEAIGQPNASDFFPMLRPLDLQGWRRRLRARFKKLYGIFDKMIDQRLKAIHEHGADYAATGSQDVLDELLQLHLHAQSLDRPTIRSLLADLFLAGTDTSTNTVEWAMAELLRHPASLAKARAELAETIGYEREVVESDIAQLPYLQAVVKETLRLHPAGPLLIPHRAEASVEMGGYTVPEGTRVLVNVWAIGRDEEVWEDAEEFRPERFLGSEVDYRGQDFELIPFGSGRRMCPGTPLAIRMVHLLLAALLNAFEWRLPEGKGPSDVDVSEKFGLSLAMATPLQAVAVPLSLSSMERSLK